MKYTVFVGDDPVTEFVAEGSVDVGDMIAVGSPEKTYKVQNRLFKIEPDKSGFDELQTVWLSCIKVDAKKEGVAIFGTYG